MTDNAPAAELQNTESVYTDVRNSIIAAKTRVSAAVNSAMVLAYWEIGKRIYEAAGDRAEYGTSLLKYLSKRLSKEFGNGFDVTNLRRMRQFYLTFQKRGTLSRELSWSHYQLLMRVENENARSFYAEEAVKSAWSVRQLSRQINSLFYERMLMSQNKDAVAEEIQRLEPRPAYEEIVKDPYVLEFLHLPANPALYESDLEQALINDLEKFLLELGRGFAFVARQKRITFDEKSFYIDLVFYNYLLKCFVLIDLKAGELTHQDIGQMQMYVNYYKREMMNEGDNKPIGIILCSNKSETLVRYTLPEGSPDDDTRIFAAKYLTCLPDEEELRKHLERWRSFHESEVVYQKESGEITGDAASAGMLLHTPIFNPSEIKGNTNK
ncbi:MAG TPA: PDDEXK nuclease domain-containing protein [Methanocorpusculum sp.]|nr:DUF1016 family protein [Candidatus Methanocorpusculum equi]MCQ2358078.1 PDDEXK nuclease domain-containing protein [Methanocorpusculum sp.]HJJ33618.1 PDDEXK nuclease domain-containing protein [Methanocorpusculum sp.]HJJ45013.1 PDDEXK nuclease domain-containing protein [Methanocorpusculum sp.]HJJ57915.1 PDDEXK nuclease domain-containing protein [Methanocorpusculum sp.]